MVEENLPAERQVDQGTMHRLQDLEETSLHADIKKGDITIETLARLNYYVKQSTLGLDLCNAAWAELLDKYETLQQLLESEVTQATYLLGSSFSSVFHLFGPFLFVFLSWIINGCLFFVLLVPVRSQAKSPLLGPVVLAAKFGSYGTHVNPSFLFTIACAWHTFC